MLSDIIKSNSFYGFLYYNENKVKNDKAERIFNTTDANSTKDMNRSFLELCNNEKIIKYNGANNNSSNTQAISFSLNFHNDTDNLSADKLNLIAQDFLQNMGYGNSPCVVYKHNDAGHQHIHIITSKYDYDLNSVYQYNDFEKSKTVCLDLSNKYNLPLWSDYSKDKHKENLNAINSEKFSMHKAIIKSLNHKIHSNYYSKYFSTNEKNYIKKNKISNDDLYNFLGHKRYNDLSVSLNKHKFFNPIVKLQLSEILEKSLNNSSNLKEYINNLSDQNIYAKQITNKKTKKPGLVYGYSGYYFNEGSLNPSYRLKNVLNNFHHHENINKHKNNNLQYFDKNTQQNFISKRINFLLKSNKNISSLNNFQSLLNENNIEMISYQNKGGIYGLSFKSFGVKNPYIFKGSEVNLNINKLNFILNKNSNSQINYPLVNYHLIDKNIHDYIDKVPEYNQIQNIDKADSPVQTSKNAKMKNDLSDDDGSGDFKKKKGKKRSL